jgi:hypothetical protein
VNEPTPRRIDRVTFLGARPATTIVIPWDSRQALLDRLTAAGGADDVITAIRAPGTSAPVRLTKLQKRGLLTACAGWLDEVGATGLPVGIVGLRSALMDEAAAGELDEDG